MKIKRAIWMLVLCMMYGITGGTFFPVSSLNAASLSAPIIIDHAATRLSQIPAQAILNAKATLHIAYGHTSNGSQLITGMTGLVGFRNSGTLYGWQNGALDLRDQPFYSALDLGNPDRTAWEVATRIYLNAHPEINVVIWSWCGQVSNATAADINAYLMLMNGLEIDYPQVSFVYMTGHLDGSGVTGNLYLRNEQIRAYCRANNKILYDFADIESYDPDDVYYGDKHPTEGCNYDYNNDGETSQSGDPSLPLNGDRNWALDWQISHIGGIDWYTCSAMHSQALNANQKAYAAWWLWARLAGWENGVTPPVVINPPANLSAQAVSSSLINLVWSAPSGSISGYMVYRNSMLIGTVTQASYGDTGLQPSSTYVYTVRAYNAQGTQSQPCAALSATTLPLSGGTLTEGLKSYWKLDEMAGRNAADFTGNSNTGIGSTAYWTTGIIGGALGFDGVDDYMDVGASDFGLASEVSVSLWVRPDGANSMRTSQVLIQRGWFVFPFMLKIYKGKLRAGIRTATRINYLTSSSNLMTGLWNLVTVTYTNGAFVIYINGVENARSNVTGPLYVPADQITRVGMDAFRFEPLLGALDDIRIYNRALSAAEAMELLNTQP